MKLRLWSDIHNEIGEIKIVRSDDDADHVLVIAGDFTVGLRHVDLLRRYCGIFKAVVYTTGNHEYYHNVIELVDERYAALDAEIPNFHFLQGNSVIIDDVRFIGGTFWTDVNRNDPLVALELQRYMNDYYQIKVLASGSRRATALDRKKSIALIPTHTSEINARQRQQFLDILAEPFAGKTVIVTHHAPLYEILNRDPDYNQTKRDRQITFGYGNTGLEDWFYDQPFDFWFHGHTHKWHDHLINGKRLMARPRGYAGHEQCANEYDREGKNAMTIEV